MKKFKEDFTLPENLTDVEKILAMVEEDTEPAIVSKQELKEIAETLQDATEHLFKKLSDNGLWEKDEANQSIYDSISRLYELSK